MVSFHRHFREFSFFHESLVCLDKRYLFHYMVESSESLVASQEVRMLNVDAKVLSFISVFSLYLALSNISLFEKDIPAFCSNACKGESSQHKDLLVTEKY